MTDVKVEQCDVDRAREAWDAVSDGWNDWSSLSQEERDAWAMSFARHRQATEKAQQERDAGIAERQYAGPGWSSHYRNAGAGVAAAIRSQGHE